jgi:hypothetical protein
MIKALFAVALLGLLALAAAEVDTIASKNAAETVCVQAHVLL